MLLGVAALVAAGGCWEEIEYTPPQPATSQRDTPPATHEQPIAEEQPSEAPLAAEQTASDAQAQAEGFGEDLADSLPEPVPSGVDVVPAPAEPATGAVAEGNDGVMPAAESDPMPADATSADYASADSTTERGTLEENSALATEEESPSEDSSDDTLSKELAAWQLGSKLSLAALAHDRGVAADSVDQWMADCKSLAVMLGTAVAELPEPAATETGQTTSREVLSYLLAQGQRVGRDLARLHGPRQAALFETALKSNLLRVLHAPGSTATEKLSAAIADASRRAELPAQLWQPLLDAVSARHDIAEVRKVVQRLHADVERHLGARAAETTER
jgi:hypothetical protein